MTESRQFIPTVAAGVVIGLIEALIAVSFGSLIFSGELASFTGQGIGLALVSMILSLGMVGLLSSEPGVVSSVQDMSTVVLALVAAGIAAHAANPAAEATYYTVLAALSITAILTGALMLLSSRFRISGIVRALPFPVVGGLLAGTGWLLTVGGFDLATSGAIRQDYFQRDVILHWLPALILGVILLFMLRRYNHFLLMPGLLAGAFVLFYSVLLVSGKSLAEAQQEGFLLGPFPEGGLLQPLTPTHWDQIDWTLITGQLGTMLTIIVLSLIMLILNISGLEIARRSDINLNAELRAAGIMNTTSGLFGGLIGFHTISLTILGYRMGSHSRLLCLVVASISALTLLAGTAILDYVPTMLLGGLLIFLGLGFLVEWFYDVYGQLPRRDYFLIILITLTVGLVGYIEGVAVGLAAALLLFAIDSSRLGMIRHAFTAADVHSKVIRSAADMAVLEQKGAQAQIYQLQGFVFFGTADQLVERVRQRLASTDLPRLRYLILDLRQVEKMDSSAIYSLLKLQQLALASDVDLIASTLPASLQAQLHGRGFTVRSFTDLDLALEEVENQLLTETEQAEAAVQLTIRGQLQEMMPGIFDPQKFAAYMQREEVQTGTILAKQHESADTLFFVESGLLSVQLAMPGEQTRRIRTVTSGAVVGELGVYLGGERTASIVVSQPGVIYRLPREALDRMRSENPALAAAFHEYIAYLLAGRLADTTEALEVALQ